MHLPKVRSPDGGDITIDSTEDHGTIVDFYIQVDLGESFQEPIVTQATVVGIEEPQSSLRILVVEDQPDNRQVLVMMLEAVGFEVKQAQDGQQALNINQAWQPHLIWMDLQLPLLNGLEATKQIKAQSHNPPVIIALTAQALESDEVKALKAGCDGYLRKPFEAAQIFDKMAQHLNLTYRYKALHHSKSFDNTNSLTADKLDKMPVSWVELLCEAATLLDEEMLVLLLKDIPTEHQALKSSLEYLIATYRYDIIMESAQAVLRS